MHYKQFDQLVARRLSACRKTLTAKGAEYSRDNDRLWNFKRAAAMDGTSPTMALLGMWKKHLVSIIDIIEGIDRGEIPSEAQVAEKFGDSINYHLLCEGLIAEQRVEPYDVPVEELATLEAELAAEEKIGDRPDFPQEAAKNLGSVPCFPSEDCLGNVCRRTRV